MARPVRVLHVVGAMNRGGAETWLMNVLRNIDREHYAMDFVVHTTQPGSYDEEIRLLGSKILPCLRPSRPWQFARKFSEILRAHGPYDVVHSHVYWFNGLPLWLAARAKVKGRIAHMYPLVDVRDQTLARKAYQRIAAFLIARYATAILTDSDSSLHALGGTGRWDVPLIKTLYCGIDLRPFSKSIDRDSVRKRLSVPLDKPLIAYVARLVPHKNHAQLLRVADRLNGNGYRYHFAIAGSHGSLLETLHEQTKEREDVTMLIGLPDIEDLLLASDLFFFPSLEEGFGLVAVEAAAAGLPVVATSLPTIREACPPGHTAYMFPPNEDVMAATNISMILDDQSLRCKLAAEGREWSERFAIEKSVQELTCLYDLYRG